MNNVDQTKIDFALKDPKYDGKGKKAIVCFSQGLDSTGLAFYLKDRGYAVELCFFDDGPFNDPRDQFFDPTREVELDSFLRVEAEWYARYHSARKEFTYKAFRYPQLNAIVANEKTAAAPDTDKAKFAESLGMSYWIGYKLLMQGILLSYGGANGFDLVVMGHLPGEDAYLDETPEPFRMNREVYVHAYPRVRIPEFENPYYDWNFTKSEVIAMGTQLGVPFDYTYSCRRMPSVQDPQTGRYVSCGHCEMCLLRLESFAKVGIPDPAPYTPTL